MARSSIGDNGKSSLAAGLTPPSTEFLKPGARRIVVDQYTNRTCGCPRECVHDCRHTNVRYRSTHIECNEIPRSSGLGIGIGWNGHERPGERPNCRRKYAGFQPELGRWSTEAKTHRNGAPRTVNWDVISPSLHDLRRLVRIGKGEIELAMPIEIATASTRHRQQKNRIGPPIAPELSETSPGSGHERPRYVFVNSTTRTAPY